MPGPVPGIHAFDTAKQGVDGRDTRAFTPVCDGLCPAMTCEDEDVAGKPQRGGICAEAAQPELSTESRLR